MIREAALDSSFPLPLDQPFTATMANEAGVSRHHLARLCGAGLLRSPIRRVYLPADLGDSLSLRAQCLHLVMPPDCVVVDRHAGWLLGAEMVLAPNEHLELRPLSVFRPSGHGRLRNKLADSGERNLRPDDVTEIEGLRVTTPLRTAWDLGRVRWTDEAISGLDAMFRLEAFTREEFLDGMERFKGMRWVRTLRAIGPLADGRSESPGESVLRLRCIECHLPTMVPQLTVWRDGGFVARLDLGNERLRFGAEYDGSEWHSTPEQREHDRRRRREVSEAGWLVKPFTSANVFGRLRDAEQLLRELHKDALARHGLRRAG